MLAVLHALVAGRVLSVGLGWATFLGGIQPWRVLEA